MAGDDHATLHAHASCEPNMIGTRDELLLSGVPPNRGVHKEAVTLGNAAYNCQVAFLGCSSAASQHRTCVSAASNV